MSAPTTANYSPAPARNRYWLVFAAALAVQALLYCLTIPSNHTEAEDSLWYAYDTREKSYHALFHLHHLLYLPVMRLIYTTVHFADAFRLMIGVDILCAVATVGLLFLWLDRGWQLRRSASLFACAFLAFSYGFWRYAVEAEVYLPAMLLQVWLAGRVFRPAPSSPSAGTLPGQGLTAILGAAAMLMHAPLSAPLAVVAVPFYLLFTRRLQALAVYGVVATALVTSAYYAAYRTEAAAHDPAMVPTPATFTEYLRQGGKSEDPLTVNWTTLPKAVPGLGAAVVSSNYLFAIPFTRDKLFAAFPTRNLAKEAFTARSYSRALAGCGLGLTVVLLGLIAFAGTRRFEWSGPRLRALFAEPETWAIFVWLAAYVALVCVIEPENPENWICSLLPIATLAGLLMHFLYRDAADARLPWVFTGLLLAQNLVGGFFVIHNPASDSSRYKSTWVLAHAHAGDVIFTRDNDVFTRFVRYYSPAKVVNVISADAATTRAMLQATPAAPGGTRYLYVDVIEPPGYMRRRNPALYDDLTGLRQELLPSLAPTGADDLKRLP